MITESIWTSTDRGLRPIRMCAKCCDREQRPALQMNPAQVAELEPTDLCTRCAEPLLQAGRVKQALERLGFAFVIYGEWSAWMRTCPAAGSFSEPGAAPPVAVVDFLVSRSDWHAPLDDGDGQVVLKRCRTWPLVQPTSLGWTGSFHWVQEHEAIPALCVSAMITALQGEMIVPGNSLERV